MKQQNDQPRKPYPSDLTDSQWGLIASLIPPPKYGGRKRTVDIREILNGIFFLLKTGCTWNSLPHDLPKAKTVYHYFRAWKNDGTWKHIHDRLRESVRIKSGREKEPSAGIIDSQSVKTTEKGGFVAMTLAKR